MHACRDCGADLEVGSPAGPSSGSGSGSAAGGQVLRCRVSAVPAPHCRLTAPRAEVGIGWRSVRFR